MRIDYNARREEPLAIQDWKWLDPGEAKAACEAGLSWMVRPFTIEVGAFGHPDLLKAIDEFDDINIDPTTGKYRFEGFVEGSMVKGHVEIIPRFHMPLAEYLRRCRLGERR